MVVLILAIFLIATIGCIYAYYGNLHLAERRGYLFIIEPSRKICEDIKSRIENADMTAEEFIIMAIEHELRR